MLELINKFSRFAGYKMNIEKSITFLYTNNKISYNEIKKTSHLQQHQTQCNTWE